MRELQAEVQQLQGAIQVITADRIAADQLVRDKDAELENNSKVFKLHYDELLARDEEIRRLKAVVEGLAH